MSSSAGRESASAMAQMARQPSKGFELLTGSVLALEVRAVNMAGLFLFGGFQSASDEFPNSN